MAKYIIRLDDACPTMDSKKWDLFERVLDEIGIKPIVAVIPNCKDKSMNYQDSDPFFWKKVKNWEMKNWNIALHGYEHQYITTQSGLVPINKQSEFSGLSLEAQIRKIRSGWCIFSKYDIKSNIWVAPSHSFDRNTLKAITAETNIKIISDGIAKKPFNHLDFFWIPQQLWRFQKKKKGIYTICYHPNTMSFDAIKQELKLIKKNKEKIVSDFSNCIDKYNNRKLTIYDFFYSKFFFLKIFIIRSFGKIIKLLKIQL